MADKMVHSISSKFSYLLYLVPDLCPLVLLLTFFFQISFQNLLFYYDNEASTRPSGLIFLEGCYCERLISAPSCLGSTSGTSGGQGSKNHKEEKLQVSLIKKYQQME